MRRRAAAIVLAVMVFSGARAEARTHRTHPFDLFAGPHALIRVNRVYCDVGLAGELCVDPTNSPVYGGGFWPAGTNDQYVFNQGLQFAALMQGPSGSPWNGDTVGAFFFDLRGSQQQGAPLTRVYDALNLGDRTRWPRAGYAHDIDLFAPSLIGRLSASEQDTWQRYWDGNPARANGRVHPMGLLVDQRTMAWSTPELEDVVFFVFRLINITATTPAAYQQLASAGYDAAEIADIAEIARTFHDDMAATYGVALPAGGYTFANAYVGFSQDADIGQAGQNYSNANLVFQSIFAYKSDFREPTWQFPLNIFAPPFAAAPGFVAEALVVSPPDTITGAPAGLWMSSNTTSGAPFPDAVGVQRLWRNLSLNLLPSDGTCSVPGQQKSRHFCQHVQSSADTRIMMSTGPTRIPAGGSVLMVIAHVQAAPVDSSPGFSLRPFIGGNMVPGLPISGARLLAGQDTIRNVDRAAGWISHANINGDTVIAPDEVLLVPRSLYWKVRQAQAAAAAGFLQPAAPEPPRAVAVPGDNRVTIAWEKSPSESAGDPYFPVASNPASPLYDPDYRRNDVEGYRVWRGRTPDAMQVIAQFDYVGTSFIDYTGQVGLGGQSQCAPELGLVAACQPFPLTIPLVGSLIQYRLGDRLLLGNGSAGVLHADTAVTGGASGRTPLADTRVPFIYVDSTVRNGESWYYAVTAFDVNSARSGRSTIESVLIPHGVTPRTASSNAFPVAMVTGVYGSDSVALDPAAPMPAIDAATGTFKGPIPPANTGSFRLFAAVREALPAGEYVARIDSVSAGFIGAIGEGPKVYLTFTASQGVAVPVVVDLNVAGGSTLPAFNAAATTERAIDTTVALVPYDSTRARLLGLPPALAANGRMPVEFEDAFVSINATSPGTALSQGRYGVGDPASRYLAHSRWFDETAGEPADPTIDWRPSRDHNSGTLTGVDSIWAVDVYRSLTDATSAAAAGANPRMNRNLRGFVYAGVAWYPADFVVTWGSGGVVSVRDSTHHTNLPYTRGLGSGYGFVSLANLLAAGITAANLSDGTGTASTTLLTPHSLYSIDPVCRPTWWGIPCAPLAPAATLQPVDMNADGTAEGSGLLMVINGEAFFFRMNALPAAGTKWHLRAVGGRGMTATCTPALATGTAEMTGVPADCSAYAYVPTNPHRPALAPGLRFKLVVTQAYRVASDSADLARVHTVPDPYYLTNALESGSERILRFVNLPDRAVIRIYSSSGVLVAMLNHQDVAGGGDEAWDLRSRSGRLVASGVYFWHVEAANGQRRVGRFVVVNRE